MMQDASKPTHQGDDESESPDVEVSHIKSRAVPFNRLVHDHLAFVWRTLRRFGVQPVDVDDAAQRVFIIANDKQDSIRPGSERSFLVAVAMRVASHTRRANQRREAAHERWFASQAIPALPEGPALRAEARDLLDRVLDKMPENLRSVFVLFELEELTINEIADLLELPRGTVATRLRRARSVFQERAKALEQMTKGRHS
jgi:RNA polymerase sigma-70 factor (ECF subfamily)